MLTVMNSNYALLLKINNNNYFMKTLLNLFLILIPFCVIPGLYSQENKDFKKYFDEYNVKGSILICDMNAGKYIYFDSARCNTAFIPASTFKIPNSIIGLETGVIADENFVIPWDGIKRQYGDWNQDLDLKTAIKLSAVPYYQELARRVGSARMAELVSKLGYGNMDVSGPVDSFWLNGKMRISQFEQIDFLKRLYKNELPVSQRSMDITKQIILNEDTLGYKLRAKTGWGNQDNKNIGWWVGWVETTVDVYFFATNIEAGELAGGLFFEARKEITRKILTKLGALPE